MLKSGTQPFGPGFGLTHLTKNVRLRSAELENSISSFAPNISPFIGHKLSIPPVRPLKHFRPVKGDNPLDFAGKELEWRGDLAIEIGHLGKCAYYCK